MFLALDLPEGLKTKKKRSLVKNKVGQALTASAGIVETSTIAGSPQGKG